MFFCQTIISCTYINKCVCIDFVLVWRINFFFVKYLSLLRTRCKPQLRHSTSHTVVHTDPVKVLRGLRYGEGKKNRFEKKEMRKKNAHSIAALHHSSALCPLSPHTHTHTHTHTQRVGLSVVLRAQSISLPHKAFCTIINVSLRSLLSLNASRAHGHYA